MEQGLETAPDVAGAAQNAGPIALDKVVGLLIVAAICALLVYTLIYMRKRFPIVREFMVFLKERKLWWMAPIVIVFFLLTILIVASTSPLAPFIYALF
ncbi:hypothetical protein FJY63_03290 [Candidatus Sumerlaeota bacterium]|nr:hypothetical protein [Candidatus Sumerlaeota bacterium]